MTSELIRTRTCVRVTTVCLTLAVAACATPDEIRSTRAPTATLESARPSDAIAACVAERWENEKILGTPVAAHGLRARPTSTGHVVTVLNQYGGVHFMADIFRRPQGSSVNFYDYNIPDPKNVPTGLPAAYSPSHAHEFISGMHRAVIECSR